MSVFQAMMSGAWAQNELFSYFTIVIFFFMLTERTGVI